MEGLLWTSYGDGGRRFEVSAGRNASQRTTGWGGYFLKIGQRMNVERAVRMYCGGAAQRWHRLSGKGSLGASSPSASGGRGGSPSCSIRER
jgi:hypothetical protein